MLANWSSARLAYKPKVQDARVPKARRLLWSTFSHSLFPLNFSTDALPPVFNSGFGTPHSLSHLETRLAEPGLSPLTGALLSDLRVFLPLLSMSFHSRFKSHVKHKFPWKLHRSTADRPVRCLCLFTEPSLGSTLNLIALYCNCLT